MARAGVTATRVVTAAAEEADLHGWEALSLAAVAQRLGVKPPSLYKHVESLTALRTAVAARSVDELADVLGHAIMGRSGTEAVTALANAYRAFALSHPGRYAATLAAPDGDDTSAPGAAHRASAARLLGVVTAAVAGYGIGEDASVHAIRAVRSALHGFVAIEAAGGFGMPHDIDASFALLVADVDSALRNRAA